MQIFLGFLKSLKNGSNQWVVEKEFLLEKNQKIFAIIDIGIFLFSDHDIDIVSRIFYIFFFSSEHRKVSSTCNQSLILYFPNLYKVKIEFQYLYIFRELFFSYKLLMYNGTRIKIRMLFYRKNF